MEAKLQELMDMIQSTQRELKADFSEQISQLKKEVTAGQESSSQEVVKKLNKRTYQFQRKRKQGAVLLQFVSGEPSGGREERASEVDSRGRATDGHSKKAEDLPRRRY